MLQEEGSGGSAVDLDLPHIGTFPEAEAQELISIGQEYGQPGVKDVVDQIRSWLGDPAEVQRIAALWADKAVHEIKQSAVGIHTALDDASYYWTGNAHQSFTGYAERLSTTVEGIQASFADMAQQMIGLARQIIATYNVAVNLIIDYAQYIGRIVYAAGITLIGIGVLDVLGIVDSAFNDFIDSVQDEKDKLVEVLTSYQEFGDRVGAIAAAFPTIDGISEHARDPEAWTVSPNDQ